MTRSFPIWFSMIFSGALFGLYHGNLTQGVYAGCFGITILLVAYRLKCLWACFFLHAGGNLWSIFIDWIPEKYVIVKLGFMIVMVVLSAACLLSICGVQIQAPEDHERIQKTNSNSFFKI